MSEQNDTQKLKLNFLEFWHDISNDDTKSLLTLENTIAVEKKIIKYSDESFNINKILLVFHAYASVAYLSAERIVNAKIYFDITKTKYAIFARNQSHEDFCFSIVYSNVKELNNHSTFPIPADNVLSYLEGDEAIEDFYKLLNKKD